MKHLKLFEQFINEANEIIKAQEVCKDAIFMAKRQIDEFYNFVQKENMLKNFTFSSKIEPYNNGYQLAYKTKWDWASFREPESYPLAKKIGMIIDANGYVYLQPVSFFESNLQESGKSHIEGKTFIIEKDQPYEITYPKYLITKKDDLKKIPKLFNDALKESLKKVKESLV